MHEQMDMASVWQMSCRDCASLCLSVYVQLFIFSDKLSSVYSCE